MTHYVSSFICKPPKQKDNVTIAMPISVGQPHCEYDALRAELKLINNTFKNSEVIFVIGSNLQRFTYRTLGLDEKQARFTAIEKGQDWLTTQKEIIDEELKDASYKIIDWEEFLENPTFQEKLSLIKETYDSDKDFQKAFNKTALKFVNNLADSGKEIADIKEALELSLQYLFEECAVQLLLALVYTRPQNWDVG